ncbi:Cytochrome c-552 [Aquimixticola soesokkakensis]|uniref:Cytochrome c-552 n=1 Tax=Aquimixticola soesokkakensis TaxID=1519096 RepID=A0A1Y5SVR1_9RHOB|nr:cytochrome c family protein [Aquimixticola soesokkakensis]SLN47682.1 Cytochrome c-552 [Aquimixticola soesokkakensis]
MFNTMTLTKVVGGLCGTFLIFLLGNWVAETIYHVGPSGSHGENEVAQAYAIEVADAGGESEEEAIPFADVYAMADADAGAKVFNKCKACHKLDGTNSTGPHLDGVVDRQVASLDGFAYSDALAGLDNAWTPEHLSEFLASPKGYAPGTKMGFAGLPKVEDRANIIAYLATMPN